MLKLDVSGSLAIPRPHVDEVRHGMQLSSRGIAEEDVDLGVGEIQRARLNAEDAGVVFAVDRHNMPPMET